MSGDRSLDDFAPGADGESESTDSDGPTADETPAHPDAPNDDAEPVDSDAPNDDAEPVDPATATSTWHADGADCDRCGERVERRWRDDDAFVCADCAPW